MHLSLGIAMKPKIKRVRPPRGPSFLLLFEPYAIVIIIGCGSFCLLYEYLTWSWFCLGRVSLRYFSSFALEMKLSQFYTHSLSLSQLFVGVIKCAKSVNLINLIVVLEKKCRRKLQLGHVWRLPASVVVCCWALEQFFSCFQSHFKVAIKLKKNASWKNVN